MKYGLIFFFIGFFLGAIAHERDMARNFNESGDAKAWVSNITCESKK